ncbi:MAG: hypothetical protein KC418_07895 [Anaerolineales bacterium]|nr:hypothetical protein [Anaerolineales bacterium]
MQRLGGWLLLSVVVLLCSVISFLSPGVARGAAAGGEEKVIRYGPVMIPAVGPYGPGYGQLEIVDTGMEMPCTDCYITSISFDVVREDGSTLNRGTDPSIVATGSLNNLARVSAACGTIGEQIFIGNPDRTPLSFPPGYGYYNPPGSVWSGKTHFKNWSTDVAEAYVEITYTYLPASASLTHMTPIQIAQSGCQGRLASAFRWRPFYTAPEGYSDAQIELTLDRGGDIVTTFGHMHDFGISNALEYLGPDPTYICTSIGSYAIGSAFAPVGPGSGIDEGHPVLPHFLDPGDPNFAGHLERMDLCWSNFHVNKGDTVRLHTQYYTSMVEPGAMGNMVMYMDVTDPPVCTLSMQLGYAENSLNVGFILGTLHEANWNLWMITDNGAEALVSNRPLPVIAPVMRIFNSIPSFPHLGKVLFVTTLTTPESGVVCSYWDAVDTGAATGETQAAGVSRLMESDWVTLQPAVPSLAQPQGIFGHELTPPDQMAGRGAVLNPANGHYYEAFATPLGINLVDAADRAWAATLTGYESYLATITSQQENDFIVENFPEVVGESGYWVGGSQGLDSPEPDGGWQWVTDEAFTYSNWQVGQPDDAGSQDAIHFYTEPGKWDDRARMDGLSGYVVEYEPTCTLEMSASYDAGTLALSFNLGSLKENTQWNTWIAYQGYLFPLFSRALPLIYPPIPVNLSLPRFPHLRTIGILTTLATAAEGIVCADWQQVDTGSAMARDG